MMNKRHIAVLCLAIALILLSAVLPAWGQEPVNVLLTRDKRDAQALAAR